MLTSKHRADSESIAIYLHSLFHIRKIGVTPELRDAVDKALEARELIKLNVLDNNMIEAKQAASILADRTGAEVVQVIGNRFILFRQSKKKPIIELPK